MLKNLTETSLPDSQELSYEVAQSVRMMEVTDFGRDKLSAGPAIEESDDIIIVEGRADVLVMLKHGFKNVITMNGTSCPQTIKELTKKKETTVFVDGDRGGNLIIRELLSVADLDFVCKAPDGKEVEELTKKEIHKALRGKITAEQAKLDLGIDNTGALKEEAPSTRQNFRSNDRRSSRSNDKRQERPQTKFQSRSQGVAPSNSVNRVTARAKSLSADEKKVLKQTMEDLFGTRGACIFDNKMNILGKVPLSELSTTIKSLSGGVYALALDGSIDLDLVKLVQKLGISHLVGTGSKVKAAQGVNVITEDKL